MSSRRVKPRAPKRAPEHPVPGQLGIFGSPDPWQTSRCDCWPPVPFGCFHCSVCDRCEDCGRCAGTGCLCECED